MMAKNDLEDRLKPENFRAPYIKREEIWRIADEFRDKYWTKNEIPIDIALITEKKLDLNIIPINNLKQSFDVDAVLYDNYTSIAVDEREYMSDKYQFRVRFSIAHEIGHYVLHRHLFEKIKFQTIAEWIKFYHSIDEAQHRFLEYHAHEFAGRLLVPPKNLHEIINELKPEIEKLRGIAKDYAKDNGVEYDIINLVDSYIAENISLRISKYFEVSDKVIAKRLERENIKL